MRARYSIDTLARKWGAALLIIGSLGTIPAHAAAVESPAPTQQEEQATAPAADAGPSTLDAPTAQRGSAGEAPRTATDVDRINGAYLKSYITDSGRLLTSPLRWDGGDWLKAGAVVGVTGALFLADKPIKSFAQKNQSSAGDALASVGNAIGDPLYAPVAVGSFYLYGIFKDDARARRTALLALESYSISSLFSTGIKTLAQRHRPETGDSPMTFDGPQWNAKNYSFASGHTSNAFAIATVFANEYSDSKIIPPVAYGLATLTAAARVYDNKHWSSDVFFGAALGYFTSKALLSFHKKESAVTIAPQVSREMLGLSVGCKF